MDTPHACAAELPVSPQSLAATALYCLDNSASPPCPLLLPAHARDVCCDATKEAYADKCPALDQHQEGGTNTATKTPSQALTDPVETFCSPEPMTVQISDGEPSTSAAPTPLPPLLRYVDNHLLRSKNLHNYPPDPNTACSYCHCAQDNATVPTTFLPLSPCGCWAHYNCLIWHATRDEPRRNRCPSCSTLLFQYEGISATTLAARTGLNMPDTPYLQGKQYIDRDTNISVNSDFTEYLAECVHLESVIIRYFYHALRLASPYADQSPDLTHTYYAVLSDLDKTGKVRIRSKWLSWNTEEGYYLYGMLVACKMRRYLVECQEGVVGTEGWKGFLNGMDILQGKILEGVGQGSTVAGAGVVEDGKLGGGEIKNEEMDGVQ